MPQERMVSGIPARTLNIISQTNAKIVELTEKVVDLQVENDKLQKQMYELADQALKTSRYALYLACGAFILDIVFHFI